MCQRAGAEEAVDLRATSLATLVQMVAGGHGFTFVPEMAVAARLAAPADVAFVPFAGKRVGRSVGLVWRRASSRGSEFRRLGASLVRQ